MPTANAGTDKTCLVNEPISLDGSASSGGTDGFQADGRHNYRWDLGYGGWTYEGGLVCPVAYPKPGVYVVTLTVYDGGGSSHSDTATVTVSNIIEGSETVVSDTGNAITNGTNLKTAITNAAGVDNPIITLIAGVTYDMDGSNYDLPNRTGAGYCTIRTSQYASLPNGTTRVFPVNAVNMAIITPGDHPSNSSINSPSPAFTAPAGATPGHHYRFLGIHFKKKYPTLDYGNPRAFLDFGNGSASALNQLPHHIQIDRCYIDGGDTTSSTTRGVAFLASDSAVVNSYIHRIKGVGLEVQAMWIGMGERIACINNYLSAGAENYLTGGADPTITNHVPTDLIVRRNHMQKELGWRSGDPAYYGVNMVVKNIFELKLGLRVSVQGNKFEDHWQEDQNWAITVTVRNQDGTASWSKISYVDFAHNKVNKNGGSVQILGSDDINPSQSIDHILFRHALFTGVSYYNGQHNTFTMTQETGGTADRISVVRCSSDSNGTGGQGRFFEFDSSTGFTNFKVLGCVCQGHFSANPGIKGTAALETACSTSSFEVVSNGFYQSDGTNPGGNTTVSTRADVKYTDIAGFNLTLAGDSPFLTTGLAGGRSGADVPVVDTLTSGTVTGAWEETGAAPVVKLIAICM